MEERQAPELVVSKTFSEGEESKEQVAVPTYATNEERMKAMREFQLEQAAILRRHHQEEEIQIAERDRVLELEHAVDEKVEDAIRHAQTVIEEVQAEVQEISMMLAPFSVQLENMRIEREGFRPDEQAQIDEFVRKYKEKQEQAALLEKRLYKAEKKKRTMADEVKRLSEFRKIRVFRQPGTKSVEFNLQTSKRAIDGPNVIGAQRAEAGFKAKTGSKTEEDVGEALRMMDGLSLQQSSRAPKYSSDLLTVGTLDSVERKLEEAEARELVARLSARQEHRKGCKCELCKAGGAVSHVKSFEPRRVRTSYSRSVSRGHSSSARNSREGSARRRSDKP